MDDGYRPGRRSVHAGAAFGAGWAISAPVFGSGVAKYGLEMAKLGVGDGLSSAVKRQNSPLFCLFQREFCSRKGHESRFRRPRESSGAAAKWQKWARKWLRMGYFHAGKWKRASHTRKNFYKPYIAYYYLLFIILYNNFIK